MSFPTLATRWRKMNAERKKKQTDVECHWMEWKDRRVGKGAKLGRMRQPGREIDGEKRVKQNGEGGGRGDIKRAER